MRFSNWQGLYFAVVVKAWTIIKRSNSFILATVFGFSHCACCSVCCITSGVTESLAAATGSRIDNWTGEKGERGREMERGQNTANSHHTEQVNRLAPSTSTQWYSTTAPLSGYPTTKYDPYRGKSLRGKIHICNRCLLPTATCSQADTPPQQGREMSSTRRQCKRDQLQQPD